jgi:DNA invertase Pin-like site-specific DNA recombinase
MFKFMLTILGAVAEMELELTVECIRERLAKTKQALRHQVRQTGRRR